jgi:hypothetical protein
MVPGARRQLLAPAGLGARRAGHAVQRRGRSARPQAPRPPGRLARPGQGLGRAASPLGTGQRRRPTRAQDGGTAGRRADRVARRPGDTGPHPEPDADSPQAGRPRALMLLPGPGCGELPAAAGDDDDPAAPPSSKPWTTPPSARSHPRGLPRPEELPAPPSPSRQARTLGKGQNDEKTQRTNSLRTADAAHVITGAQDNCQENLHSRILLARPRRPAPDQGRMLGQHDEARTHTVAERSHLPTASR